MQSSLSHCFPSNRKRGSPWKAAVSMQSEIPQVAWQAYRYTCKLNTWGDIYPVMETHPRQTPYLYIQSTGHILVTPCCIHHHVCTTKYSHKDSAQLLQTPIPINRVKQICSVLAELSSDIKHLLSSYHQATLSLCEHHKAGGNTDNMLQVYVQHTVSWLWQTMLWLCYKQTNFHVFKLKKNVNNSNLICS